MTALIETGELILYGIGFLLSIAMAFSSRWRIASLLVAGAFAVLATAGIVRILGLTGSSAEAFTAAAAPVAALLLVGGLGLLALGMRRMKVSEYELRQSEALFRRLTENSRDLIFRQSLVDGCYQYISPAAEARTGYAPQEFYDDPDILQRMILPERREQAASMWARIFEGDAPAWMEYPIRHKSGEIRWIHQRNVVIRDANGTPITLEGNVTDITALKRIENALRTSEELNQRIIEAVPGGVVHVDAEGGINRANAEALRILGLTYDELTSRYIAQFESQTVWEDGSPCPADEYPVARALQTGEPQGPVIIGILRPDQSLYWAVFRAIPLFHPDNEEVSGAVATFLDITERKQAEEALKAAETVRQSILDSSPDYVMLVNLDGAIEYINRTIDDLAIPDVIGQPLHSFLAPTFHDVIRRCFEQVAATGETGQYEIQYVNSEEETIYFENRVAPILQNGKVEGYVVNGRDITEKKKSDEALRASEEVRRSITESSPDFIIMLDRYGKIVYMNRTITGRPIDEIVGTSVLDHTPPQLRNRLGATLQRTFEKGESATYEFELGHDPVRSFSVRVTPVVRDGKVSAIVLTNTETTERKRLEAQLVRSQKLESLGILAGGIAHDFNNLLTGILGFAELMESEVAEQSKARTYLDQITTTAMRAADLSQQMLAYSGKGTFQVEPVDLAALAREMEQLLTASISKKAEFTQIHPPDPVYIEADRTQLSQVLLNLIINASEALEDRSGRILLETGPIYCDRALLDRAYLQDNLPEGDYVYLRVRDTGCGMDKDTLSKIFDPFFTTKFTGRGLGLATVLGIVRSHNGTLAIESQRAKGTTFTIFLPAMPVEIPEQAEPAVFGASLPGSGTALIAEDEDIVRRLTSTWLKRMGFQVLAARDGQEALEIYRTHQSHIDLILLDLTMPRLGGLEVLEELNRLGVTAPVILLSGYSESEAKINAGEHTVGFLHKPYKVSTLRATLQEAFKSANGGNK